MKFWISQKDWQLKDILPKVYNTLPLDLQNVGYRIVEVDVTVRGVSNLC